MTLEMRNISKRFGATQALDQVALSVGDSEIHGLLGENGAGKSTLMNILAGIYPADAGEILIDDTVVSPMNSKKAAALGIRFIHQELNLINDLKVYENLFMGEELTSRFGLLNKREMIARSHQVLRELNLDIDPLTVVSRLDTSRKQMVEIAKALLFDARLIIMDEPTTALTNHEIEHLFSIMRGLKERGVSMIYISHKMPELFSVCGRYTVFRNGRFIESGNFSDIDELGATQLLVGGDFSKTEAALVSYARDEVVLEARGLSCAPYFEDISFSLKKGEVVAITGLHGDGRGELAETLFGARSPTAGAVLKNGKPLPKGRIRRAMAAGVAMVPRNRKERSILPDLSILDNMFMADYLSRRDGAVLKKPKLRERYRTRAERMNLKARGPLDLITSLSGGNQQKVVVSRWLETDPDVLLLDNPTQGIDVGAKFEIHQMIRSLAEGGKSILVFTAEYPEIEQTADRCLVMYRGRIGAELSREQMSEASVMLYATGAGREEQQHEG